MRYEELTTPEAVLAAFEAGRLVGFNTLLNFDESGWVRVLQSDPHARLLRVGRLRALIEEPAIPEGFTAWGGGDCPEGASGRRLTVVMRNGELVTGGFGIFLWPHTGSDYDIIAYRVESEPKPEPAPSAVEALAEAERLRKDAERYRWLRDLPCCSVSVGKNEGHAVNYMTMAEWVDLQPECYADVPQEELNRMIETNADWSVQVYPNTPIGFNVWRGATLDAAIDAAILADHGSESQ
jgi:hypothetical protein